MKERPIKCHYCGVTDCDKDADRSACGNFHLLASITDRCTRSCDHCLQSAGPKGQKHMSLETAAAISQFARETGAVLQIYGGEVICHPHWEEILSILLNSGVSEYIIHTNGVWEGNPALTARFLKAVDSGDAHVALAISNDGFHDLEQMERACLCVTTALKESSQPKRFKLINTFNDGAPLRISRRKYHRHLLPLGRARRYACSDAGKKRNSYCPHERTIDGPITSLVLPDGDVYAMACGVKRLGHITANSARERGDVYRSWRLGIKPDNCRACIATHKGDMAWEG